MRCSIASSICLRAVLAVGLPAFAVVSSTALTGCLGGDDTSVAPPPTDAGADATTKDAAATPDASETTPTDAADGADADASDNPFG